MFLTTDSALYPTPCKLNKNKKISSVFIPNQTLFEKISVPPPHTPPLYGFHPLGFSYPAVCRICRFGCVDVLCVGPRRKLLSGGGVLTLWSFSVPHTMVQRSGIHGPSRSLQHFCHGEENIKSRFPLSQMQCSYFLCPNNGPMQRLGCVCVREPLWYLLSELGESVGLFGLVKLFYLGLPGSLESKALASACPAGRFVFTFVPALCCYCLLSVSSISLIKGLKWGDRKSVV